MCQEQHGLQIVQQHGLHICSWVAFQQVGSSKRIDPVIEINTSYFELPKNQGNLSREMGFPDRNRLSAKCLAQEEALAVVIEISGFLYLAQLILSAIFPFRNLIGH